MFHVFGNDTEVSGLLYDDWIIYAFFWVKESHDHLCLAKVMLILFEFQ